mmetsp:Transcript_4613/g.15845  ORF Transcript_4613/g.15845 Transcript_4613/m.15845 type:complete len:207 (-) Transcript_4613:473-1093(-)
MVPGELIIKIPIKNYYRLKVILLSLSASFLFSSSSSESSRCCYSRRFCYSYYYYYYHQTLLFRRNPYSSSLSPSLSISSTPPTLRPRLLNSLSLTPSTLSAVAFPRRLFFSSPVRVRSISRLPNTPTLRRRKRERSPTLTPLRLSRRRRPTKVSRIGGATTKTLRKTIYSDLWSPQSLTVSHFLYPSPSSSLVFVVSALLTRCTNT